MICHYCSDRVHGYGITCLRCLRTIERRRLAREALCECTGGGRRHAGFCPARGNESDYEIGDLDERVAKALACLPEPDGRLEQA